VKASAKCFQLIDGNDSQSRNGEQLSTVANGTVSGKVVGGRVTTESIEFDEPTLTSDRKNGNIA
jgi:hypothetical protein